MGQRGILLFAGIMLLMSAKGRISVANVR